MADVQAPVEQWGHFAVRSWGRKLTYRAYIPPRLEPLTKGLSLSLAQLLAEAERSLRDLQAHRAASDRHEDNMAALGHQLLRAESVASSRIEGSRVSHRGLARALYNSGTITRSTRAVVGNVRAMERAIQIGASNIEFRLENLQAMQAALLQAGDAPGSPGEVRGRQTWIGGKLVYDRRGTATQHR